MCWSTLAFADETSSSASTQTIKIGYYESREFQEGASDGAVKSGYGYEYLQKVASYAGFRYEYVYGTWADLYEQLACGDIDMLAGVSDSGAHASEVLFPSVGMLNETFYISKHSQDTAIRAGDASTFSGKTIGVAASSAARGLLETWEQSNACNANIVPYSSSAECVSAFSSGAIDAFVSADNVVHGLDGAQSVEIVGREPYYLAVAPTRPDVLLKVNEALTIMNGQDKVFLANLQSRYTADTAVNSYLSAEELDWTASHATVTIGYLDLYLPFCDTLSDGQPTGFMLDVVSAMLDNLPISWEPDIRYVGFANQSDLIAALEAGQVDLAFPVGGSAYFAEQLGYLRSSAVVSPSMDLVVTNVDGFDSQTARLAVNRNNLMQLQYVQRYFPDARVVEFDSIEECLQAVLDGRVDGTVANGLRATSLIASMPRLSNIALPDPDERCVAVAQGNEALLRLVNRGIGIVGEEFCMNASYRYTEGLAKYTVTDFVRDNWQVIAVLLIIVLVAAIVLSARHYRRLQRETQREIEQNRRLEEALQTAERASRAKDVLLSNLSHDIRTPLNGILGVMEVNSACADEQTVQQNMAKAKLAARQLTGLVDDLLEMSKLKSGDIEIASEPFDMCELVDDVLSVACVQASEAGVTLSLDADYEPLAGQRVCGNPTYVRQVFANVLDNAVRYNKQGGSVACRLRFACAQPDETVMRCSVTDTGIGMSREFLARIFEPFAQEAESARSVYPGSGLGMPIVKALVELMGGTIDVTSAQGEGTTVSFELPFNTAPAQPAAAEAPGAGAGSAGMRLLLVEDNELNLDITRCVLEREGAQAVSQFEASAPGSIDAVLMDVMMPVMDGYTATRAIRALARPDAAAVPIIAMTANVFADDRSRALAAGMNEHLSKPLDTARLVATLTRYRQART